MASLYAQHFPEHIMVRRGLLSDPAYLERRILSADEAWVVAEHGRTMQPRILGAAALAIARPVGLGEIERVCVDRAYRGKGVAYALCGVLVEDAQRSGLGFIEAFARGDQPSMQRTFEKLGFRVYGVAPRFEVVHGDRIMREQFVHMGLELRPEAVDERSMVLIPAARAIYESIRR